MAVTGRNLRVQVQPRGPDPGPNVQLLRVEAMLNVFIGLGVMCANVRMELDSSRRTLPPGQVIPILAKDLEPAMGSISKIKFRWKYGICICVFIETKFY